MALFGLIQIFQSFNLLPSDAPATQRNGELSEGTNGTEDPTQPPWDLPAPCKGNSALSPLTMTS